MCLIGDIWGKNQTGSLKRMQDFILNYTAHFSKIDTNGSSAHAGLLCKSGSGCRKRCLLISSALFGSRACILGCREFDLYHDFVPANTDVICIKESTQVAVGRAAAFPLFSWLNKHLPKYILYSYCATLRNRNYFRWQKCLIFMFYKHKSLLMIYVYVTVLMMVRLMVYWWKFQVKINLTFS